MPRVPTPGRMRTRRWLSAVVVSVLAVVVVVLSVLAFQRTQGTPVEGTPRPVPSFSATPSATPDAAPPAPPVTSPAATITVPGAAERFLSAGSGVLWRATAGACGEVEPLLERSADGGQTWSDVTPRYLGIGQILGLAAFAGTEAQLIARMGDACEVQGLRTFTQGRFWEPNADVLAAATYIDPAAPGTVVVGSASREAPCAAPWGVRATGATLALICDGTAYALSGDEWQPVGENAVAVTTTADEVIPATIASDCPGVRVGSSCLGTAAPTAPVALTPSELWLDERIVSIP